MRAWLDTALRYRLSVIALFLVLLGWGLYSFHQLPVEAYPDVADTWVQVITQWPGHAAEQVEQQVTVPLEVQLNGVEHVTTMRSVSLAGLSVVTLIFDDQAQDRMARLQTLERLSQVTLPGNITPQLGPDYSPVGQIQFFTLESTNPNYGLTQLKTLEDWVVEKHLKTVPGVVDVSSFGGLTKQFQVIVDPGKLAGYGLSLAQVEQALAANNANSGGSFIEQGSQAYNIRGIGLMTSPEDIGATVIAAPHGTPIRVSDVATVQVGHAIRLGQIGMTIHHVNGVVADHPDVVEGIVLLRKGYDAEPVLKALHAAEDDLNRQVLPPGVRLVPYLDRSDLVHLTTHTVLHNLLDGMLLVVVILFLFLGNGRSALIVAITIPFSLLFASICLGLAHVPANLLSLGALDFGMVVDGSVVMVENILLMLSLRPEDNPWEIIRQAAHQVIQPIFYAVFIIITAYLPIFTLQRVEGRLFRPMAWTVAFALLGSLLFSLFITPVLSTLLFRKPPREWHNPVLEFLINRYRGILAVCVDHPGAVTATVAAMTALALALVFGGAIGSEFLPHLDEGAIWVRGTLPPSTGPTEAGDVMRKARIILARFPEVTEVVSQMGRPDDGTDATGFFNTEYYVGLKPRSQWRPRFDGDKDRLIAAMDHQLGSLPGVLWNFSQPISDNVEEAVSGVKGQSAVKLVGTDLKTMERLAEQIRDAMATVPGTADLGIFRELEQPNVNIVIDRQAAARYGLNVADVQDAIEAAVGGKAVTQILEGEQRFDLTVRYPERDRATVDAIAVIRILAPNGERVSLGQVAAIRNEEGASMIYRENNERYIAIKFSVRGRDLGSTVRGLQQAVARRVRLPQGYRIEWAGEYASEQRANRRLAFIIPVTVVLIFFLLYAAFTSMRLSLLVLLNAVLSGVGAIYALFLTGTNFSVSSGVGLLALFGVSVLAGVVTVAYAHDRSRDGAAPRAAALEAGVRRFRPVLITVLVASFGLVPAAVSHGIGSDAQRPFAIVVVGGLAINLLFSLLLIPTWYAWWGGARVEAQPSAPVEQG